MMVPTSSLYNLKSIIIRREFMKFKLNYWRIKIPTSGKKYEEVRIELCSKTRENISHGIATSISIN